MGTPIRDRLRDALTEALKARDRDTANVMRSALAAIGNAEAVDVPGVDVPGATAGAIENSPLGLAAGDVVRRELTEEQVRGIVRDEIAAREAAARTYEASGAASAAARLRNEAAALTRLCER